MGRVNMSRKEYKKYLQVLELGPDASLVEIKKSYLHLKRLYSTESVAISPIAEEFSAEKRKEILSQIEEAYFNLLDILEEEDRKIRKREKKITFDIDRAEAKEEAFPLIEKVLKQAGSVLRAENLKKSYGNRLVVKGVNLEVRSGEIIGLLGRNGAGKTTTFQMVSGLIKPDSGAIYLNNTDISPYSTHKRATQGITYLPQENSVFLKTTVENNLKLVWELQGNKKRERMKLAEQLLEELGLEELSRQPAYSLSGGERRKLEICRALILNPKFLLLDEPFTGIDPLTIIDLQKILIKLRNKGIGIVLSDHNVRDTFKIADRAYIIEEGEILIEGSPQEVASNGLAKERFLGIDFKLGEEVTHSS
jgi:lipopolysaccharide export system ATP-binding protein